MKKLLFPSFINKPSFKIILISSIIQFVLVILFLEYNGNEVLPKPSKVLNSLYHIVISKDFIFDFVATLSMIFKSMFIAIGISLFFIYLSIIPIFRNVSNFISKLRFLTYTGLVFVFTVIFHNGTDIKLSLFLFAIIPYFVTSLLSYVKDIPQKEYELCYTLKFNEFQTLYEVVIKGQLHTVFEVIRQNFAIAWMMITSVEAYSMSEGGLGTMMIKSNKYLNMNDVFAVLIIILLLGIFFDYLFDLLKVYFFPYTNMKRYETLWINKLFNNGN
jgi:NitT/TauT family transport system permease protein